MDATNFNMYTTRKILFYCRGKKSSRLRWLQNDGKFHQNTRKHFGAEHMFSNYLFIKNRFFFNNFFRFIRDIFIFNQAHCFDLRYFDTSNSWSLRSTNWKITEIIRFLVDVFFLQKSSFILKIFVHFFACNCPLFAHFNSWSLKGTNWKMADIICFWRHVLFQDWFQKLFTLNQTHLFAWNDPMFFY